MEDLATDRIYRLMIAQRMRHHRSAPIVDENGAAVDHGPDFIHRCFDEELARLIDELPAGHDLGTNETLREARRRSEEMILNGWFDPV
jgi:malate synthase